MRSHLLLCLVWLVPLAALADEGSEASEAKKFYELGRLNYDLGRHAEALDAFEKAYAQTPLPGFHFNIGQCQRKLEDYEGAIASFEQYLEKMPDASNREMVEELIAEARERKAEADARAATQPAPVEEPPVGETTSELAVADAPPAPEQTSAAPAPEAEPSVFETWWFWTAVGGGALVVAAGATTAVLVAMNQEQPADQPSLGRVDLRGAWSW